MKKSLFLHFLFLALTSCFIIEDDAPTITYENEALSEVFLINEEWFLSTVSSNNAIDLNSDGEKTQNLLSQFLQCQIDDSYSFQNNNGENIVYLKENGISCNEEVLQTTLSYQLNINNKTLNLNNLIGFETNYILKDIEFLIEVNEGYKVIIGEFKLEKDNQENTIRYSIINEKLSAHYD